MTKRIRWSVAAGTLWLLLALGLTIISNPALFGLPFSIHEHGWVSAHMATMARNFAKHGVLALCGIPMQNNGFLEGGADVYLHWPPFFPIFLSWIFSIFGTSEITAFWVMFAIQVANATLLFLIARRLLGLDAAVFTAFAWFTLPVVIDFGYLVVNLSFALVPTLAAILFLVRYAQRAGPQRANVLFGSAAMAVAVLSTWEPVLMGIALWATVILLKDQQLRAPAMAYGMTAVATAACVLAWYGFLFPEMAKDLLQVALFRAGFSESKLREFNIYEFLVGRHESATTLRYQLIVFVDRLRMLGMIGVIAVGASLLDLLLRPSGERDNSLWFTTLGLGTFWLLWALLMRQHYVIHRYEMMAAAPLAAFACGTLTARLLQYIRSWVNGYHRRIALWVLLAVVPIAMVLELSQYARIMNAISTTPLFFPDVTYGLGIREHTPADAVVITTTASMVPVYYSERHIIRGVDNETLLKDVMSVLDTRSGGRPIYLAALQPTDAARFPNALHNLTPVYQGEDLLLFPLREGMPALSGNTLPKSTPCS